MASLPELKISYLSTVETNFSNTVGLHASLQHAVEEQILRAIDPRYNQFASDELRTWQVQHKAFHGTMRGKTNMNFEAILQLVETYKRRACPPIARPPNLVA